VAYKVRLVDEHVRVRVRGHGEVTLADMLADPGPRACEGMSEM
jgi:hypothetical protein